MATTIVAVLLTPLAVTPGVAQEPIVEWSFDRDSGPLQSFDPNGQLSVTGDENIVREEGNPVAEYSYTTTFGGFAGVMAQLDMAPAGAESLHFWIRTSDPSPLMVSLSEADGSRYMAGFYSLAERWQEVALGLGEFALDDRSTDENGRLDAEQVAGLGLIDGLGFLKQLTVEVPFIDLPELGPRRLWLDDVSFDGDAIPPRWEVIDLNGVRAVRLDSFESTPLHWMLMAGENAEVGLDQDFVGHGDFSLRVTYTLKPDKLLALVTGPGRAPIEGAAKLRLSLMSESATTILVGLKEKDGSEYRAVTQLPAGDDLAETELQIADFGLDDDGQDENGQLDLGQVTEFSIVEASSTVGQGVGWNTLWIDDVLFIE